MPLTGARRTAVARRAGLIVVALLAAAVAGEYSVRFAEPELDPTTHIHFAEPTRTLPVLGPRNAVMRQFKNTGDYDVLVRFNRYGLRDSKDLATASPVDYSLVGDSFTFGWGIKENDRVSERLQALIGRPVFNLSMPEDIDGYEKLLDYAIATGAPVGNVIIAVSMETDLGLYKRPASAVAAPAAPPPDKRRALLAAKVYLTRHSAIYLLVTSLVHRVPVLANTAAAAGLLVPNLQGVRMHKYSDAVIDATVRRLGALVRRFNTTVVVIPSRALWHGANRAVEARVHEAFVARARAAGMDVLDLRPAFERGGAPLSLHFANDPHWNRRGHAVAARAIARHLEAARHR